MKARMKPPMVAPGMLPKPAEDDDGEGLERGEIAHGRVDDEHGAQQRAGRGGEARAQRERRGVDEVDLDAHQRRRLAVLEGGAHGLAELGAIDERVGAGDQRQRHDEHEQPVPRHRHRARAPAARTGTGCRSTWRRPTRRAARRSAARSRRRSSPAWWCRCRRPRSRRSRTNSMRRAQRDAEQRPPARSARKKFTPASITHMNIM